MNNVLAIVFIIALVVLCLYEVISLVRFIKERKANKKVIAPIECDRKENK